MNHIISIEGNYIVVRDATTGDIIQIEACQNVDFSPLGNDGSSDFYNLNLGSPSKCERLVVGETIIAPSTTPATQQELEDWLKTNTGCSSSNSVTPGDQAIVDCLTDIKAQLSAGLVVDWGSQTQTFVQGLFDGLESSLVSQMQSDVTAITALLVDIVGDIQANGVQSNTDLNNLLTALQSGITVNAVQSGVWSVDVNNTVDVNVSGLDASIINDLATAIATALDGQNVTILGQPIDVNVTGGTITTTIANTPLDITGNVTIDGQPISVDANITNSPLAVSIDSAGLATDIATALDGLTVNVDNYQDLVDLITASTLTITGTVALDQTTIDAIKNDILTSLSDINDSLQNTIRVEYIPIEDKCILDSNGDRVPNTGVFSERKTDYLGTVTTFDTVLSIIDSNGVWSTYTLGIDETVGDCPSDNYNFDFETIQIGSNYPKGNINSEFEENITGFSLTLTAEYADGSLLSDDSEITLTFKNCSNVIETINFLALTADITDGATANSIQSFITITDSTPTDLQSGKVIEFDKLAWAEANGFTDEEALNISVCLEVDCILIDFTDLPIQKTEGASFFPTSISILPSDPCKIYISNTFSNTTNTAALQVYDIEGKTLKTIEEFVPETWMWAMEINNSTNDLYYSTFQNSNDRGQLIRVPYVAGQTWDWNNRVLIDVPDVNHNTPGFTNGAFSRIDGLTSDPVNNSIWFWNGIKTNNPDDGTFGNWLALTYFDGSTDVTISFADKFRQDLGFITDAYGQNLDANNNVGTNTSFSNNDGQGDFELIFQDDNTAYFTVRIGFRGLIGKMTFTGVDRLDSNSWTFEELLSSSIDVVANSATPWVSGVQGTAGFSGLFSTITYGEQNGFPVLYGASNRFNSGNSGVNNLVRVFYNGTEWEMRIVYSEPTDTNALDGDLNTFTVNAFGVDNGYEKDGKYYLLDPNSSQLISIDLSTFEKTTLTNPYQIQGIIETVCY